MEHVEIISLGIAAGFGLTVIPFIVAHSIGALFGITKFIDIGE